MEGFLCVALIVLELRDASVYASQVLELKACATRCLADNFLITRLFKIKGTQLLSQLINDSDNETLGLNLKQILEDRTLEGFADEKSILFR